MDKKNIDWSNLGFGMFRQKRDLSQILKMVNGMMVS